jgi:hypothetical protein
MKTACLLIIIVSASAMAQTDVAAQAPGNVFYRTFSHAGPEGDKGSQDVLFKSQVIGDGPPMGAFAMVDTMNPVTGEPYTATATTETLQVLADGNRIANRTTAFLARDSQGRTRREEALGTIGALALDGSKIAFVNDPVSKTNYILDLQHHSAHAISTNSYELSPRISEQAPNNEGKKVFIAAPVPPGAEQRIWVSSVMGGSAVKTEALGTQVVDGITVVGKKVTRTIPAGQIGNERALEITSEVWSSPELHITVLSKRNDPRFGETVYRLTDIKRAEPDHSLFEVPENFSIEKTGGSTQ